MQFLEKPWKILENTEKTLVTTEARRNYLVQFFFSKNLLAIEMRKCIYL